MTAPFRVLVVDDDAEERLLLVEGLRENGGFLVEEATSGEAAIAELSDNDYAVVVSDLEMPPGLNGLAVWRAVQRLPRPPCFILVSGHPDLEATARRAGIRWCLLKPFNLEDLLGIFRAVRTSSTPGLAPAPL
ncbi:MAG: response regulator [Candidatus Magasanikbacteria bacterium]|nr:response regulator [Candidatus Magasanikbacteria bacterium]